MENKEAIEELLVQAENVILRAENMCMASDGPVSPTITEMSDDDITEIYKAVHQAIALLKPWPTCGGSRKKFIPQEYDAPLIKPCPDCADKPDSQEPAEPGQHDYTNIHYRGLGTGHVSAKCRLCGKYIDTKKTSEEELRKPCPGKPKSHEPGLAKSEYMSAEMREKFEAKNVPEKVETVNEWPKEELKVYGYADGGYIGKCHTCNKQMEADKRAIICRNCAMEMLCVNYRDRLEAALKE